MTRQDITGCFALHDLLSPVPQNTVHHPLVVVLRTIGAIDVEGAANKVSGIVALKRVAVGAHSWAKTAGKPVTCYCHATTP